MDGKIIQICLLFISAVSWNLIRAQRSYGKPEPVLTDPVQLEPMCEADAVITGNLIQCGSCDKRCGTITDPDDLSTVYPDEFSYWYPDYFTSPGHLCACDQYCSFYGDCCEDFQQFCPGEYQKYEYISGKYPFSGDRESFTCKSIWLVEKEITMQIISHCIDGTECKFVSYLNSDINTFVPMYDPNRGIHYISGHCALCNNARDVIPWGVTLGCSPKRHKQPHNATSTDPLKQYIINRHVFLNSTDSLKDILVNANCKLWYSPSGDTRDCHGDVVSSCNSSCQNQDLIDLCEHGPQALTALREDNAIYRNRYCAVCNAMTSSTNYSLQCKDKYDYYYDNHEATFPGVKPSSFALTLVFDFNPQKGLTVGKHSIPDCEVGTMSDGDKCRAIICPPGLILEKTECIPEKSSMTFLFDGTLKKTKSVINNLLNQEKRDLLKYTIGQGVADVLYIYNITTKNLIVNTSYNYNGRNTFIVESVIDCNCDYSSLLETGGNKTVGKFRNFLEISIRKEVVSFLIEHKIYLDIIQTTINLSMSTVLSAPSTQECIWLYHAINETNYSNNVITIIATRRKYGPDSYEILHDGVIVCENNLHYSFEESNVTDLALSIITLICVGISIICLVTRVILQFFIDSFKSRPGKVQLQLTLAFLLAFLMLLCGPFLASAEGACVIAAVLLAYGFLAAFIWMSVIAIDTWLVFRPASAFSRANDKDKSLLLLLIIGWGIPMVLAAMAYVIHFADIDKKFKPNFGGNRCWYTERYAMLIYFGIPIGISILLNSCLYIHTSINLHKAFKHSIMNKDEKYSFAVYIRLLILMGITWIFGFISAFTDSVAVDIIFVILTSLQGLFLFISFVCNRRVISEVRKVFSSPAKSSSPESTPLNKITSKSNRQVR